ncbi:PRC-barrel domain-containing protein AvaK [Calothrix sp. NIES-4071]|nr:PRC-barrel domain-containing protein AvaK [Calothrix sp. NIES-4071]BAZ55184.1 PRC-barrel domain-containing protein AvaK [Calothrix sp. NIES-4105]
MALLKIEDFHADYDKIFHGNTNIVNFSVYSDITNEKIGAIEDILVDEIDGSFRYLIVDLGFWIFGKQVLLPIGRSRIDYSQQRIYTKGLTKEQAENLPEFTEELQIDDDYEERVRTGYRNSTSFDPIYSVDPLGNPIAPTVPYGPMALNEVATLSVPHTDKRTIYTPESANSLFERNTYRYENEPLLYEINEKDHPSLKSYLERLAESRNRQKKH